MENLYIVKTIISKLKPKISFLIPATIIFFLNSFNTFGQEEIRIMSYNILNYPKSYSIDSLAVVDTTGRNPYFRTIFSSIGADIIVVEEIQREVDAQAFLSNVINASGENYALGFKGSSDDDNCVYYKTDKFEYISGIIVHSSGGQGSHTIVEYRLSHKVTLDTIVIFATHLHAFEDSLGFARRTIEATAMRERTNAFQPGTYFIAIGDFNTYYGTEAGLQILLDDASSSTGYFIDPLNWGNYTDWSGVPPELYKFHSWATRKGSGDYLGGGSQSGLDERLDLLLISQSVMNAGGITYKPGSFFVYGNDGLHLNIDINDNGNTGQPNQAVSQTIADALYYASDHLPVIADFYFGSSDVGSPTPGSIVFTQVGADDPEVIEFITLETMDLTKLKLTNSEVSINGDLVNGDGTYDLSNTTWTDVPGGTFVRLGSDLSNDNNFGDRILAYDGTGSTVPTLSTGNEGTQLIAYTGTAAQPTYIAGISWGAKDGWLPDGESLSYAPGTLSDLWLKDRDNFYYEKSVDGDATETRLALTNRDDWKDQDNRVGYQDLTSEIGNNYLRAEFASLVFTQVGADDPEVIEFITLKTMDLTQLKITNSKVNANGDLVNGDGTFDLSNTNWTNIPGGTFVRLGSDLTNDNDFSDRIIAYDGTGSTVPTLSTGNQGTQLIAYTGTTAQPTYIAGISWGAKDGWLPDGESQSYAPGTSSDFWLKDRDNFYYKRSVDGDATETRLALTKRDNWKDEDNRVGYQDLTSNIGSSSLPVELAYFAGTLIGNSIDLHWRTETEVNNYGFEVERRVCSNQFAADNWARIGFVEGYGNTNSPKKYNFIDVEIKQSGKYYYRLKQIDNDGTFEYSQIISIDFGIPDHYSLSQNYPNPFNPVTRIDFTLPEKQIVVLRVYNMLGELVKEIINKEKEAGSYTITFNSTGLASGIYIYRLETFGYTTNRKMIVLK